MRAEILEIESESAAALAAVWGIFVPAVAVVGVLSAFVALIDFVRALLERVVDRALSAWLRAIEAR